MTDPVERNRVREDVRRPREGRTDHAPESERDRKRGGNPAQGRAAQEIRLDEEHVRCSRERHAHDESHDECDQEASEADARLADRRRSGSHEQGGEHGECDEVAEREVDDPREPVDERVPDGEDAVDAAGGESGDDHLDDQAHGRTLLSGRVDELVAAAKMGRSAYGRSSI